MRAIRSFTLSLLRQVPPRRLCTPTISIPSKRKRSPHQAPTNPPYFLLPLHQDPHVPVVSLYDISHTDLAFR